MVQYSHMSKALKELGKRIAEREGLVPLRPGQRRPDGYYVADHATGKRLVPRNAVVNVQPEENSTVVNDRGD